jgi:4,5-DOPA dioxygenase extradiol
VSPPAAARQPALFIGHGAPAFTLSEADATNRWLRRLGPALRAGAPRAVLVVSAHYTAPRLRVTGADAPATLHDHDFAAARSFMYPAPGSRALARRVIELLLHAGLSVTLDDATGLDHGAWMPLSLMFPEHDLPVIELSVHASGDPELHLAMGRAIEPLRDEGVLVLGSGGTTHNQAEFARSLAARADPHLLPAWALRFDAWVGEIVTRAPPFARGRGLSNFRRHPNAHLAMPTDEHFMPLLVVVGAASGDRSTANVGELIHAGGQHGLSMSAFRFAR